LRSITYRDVARRVTEAASDTATKWRLVTESALGFARQGGRVGSDEKERADRLQEASHILDYRIKNPRRRAAARVELVPVVAEIGGARRAAALVRMIRNERFERALGLAALLRTRVIPEGISEPAQWIRAYGTLATQAIDDIEDLDQRVKAARDVARALAVAGEPQRAAAVTAGIPGPVQQARTRVDLVREAVADEPATAVLRDEAEADLLAVPDVRLRLMLAVNLLRLCADDRPRVRRLADHVESALPALPGLDRRSAVVELACALAAANVRGRSTV
jgi:hypothetical protein